MSAITLNAIPSLGALVGVQGTDSLLKSINAELNNSNFFNGVNDILSQGRMMFTQNIIQPIRAIGNTIKNLVGMMDHDERIVPITSEDLLKSVPVCMHDPIMRYAPIKKLFDQGRIFGFGWDYVPEEDIYGRLINNGYVADVQEAMNAHGDVEFEWEWHSTDPELSFDELESIRETREYLDTFLRETDMDPTDYPNTIG